MKFFSLAIFLAAFPLIQATDFGSTCTGVNSHMSGLSVSIKQIKAVAQKKGHKQIASKCDEAQSHLNVAQSSWGNIFSGFSLKPWHAKASPHGINVITRLSGCGESLKWIYARPEIQAHPEYRTPVSSCRSSYTNCQSGCRQIWNWPAPKPRPSQIHEGYGRRHKRTAALDCPASETACPISSINGPSECIDTQTEITSCGGCVLKKQGENCLDILGADGVGCYDGTCIVFSTKEGYSMNESGRPERSQY